MNICYFYNRGGNAILKYPSLYFDYWSSPPSVSCSCGAPLPHRKFSSFLHKSRSYSSSKAPCPPDCPCQVYSQRAYRAPPELWQGSRHVRVGHRVLRTVLCTRTALISSLGIHEAGALENSPHLPPAPSLLFLFATIIHHDLSQ